MKQTLLILIAVFFLVSSPCPAETPPVTPPVEELHRAFGVHDFEIFQSPPKHYRPETWFHFIGGNVSHEGITADLEAIATAGISGVQLFHGQFGGPWPGVEPQIPCLSADWNAAVRHTAEECKRLGLRFTMQNCPGWAMSGGPWIEPEHAMRHLVWSRTDIDTKNGGAIQTELPMPQPSGEEWRDYRDIAVLAFPTPKDDTDRPLEPETVSSNRDDLPWQKCLAGRPDGHVRLGSVNEENPHWIEVAFSEPVTLRTVEFSSINGFLHQTCYVPDVNVKVEALLSETETKTIFRLDMPQSSWQDDRPISLACDETTAKKFRITIVNKHVMNLHSLRLFSAARKNNWESEAGWTLRSIVREGEHPRQSTEAFVDFDRIVDLSEYTDENGKLEWDIPSDNNATLWTILRIGHVNTGMRNGPAPPEGTGWECDKLSKNGPDRHFAGYVGRLTDPGGPLEDGLLGGLLLDSWECKTQTWTPELESIFERKQGYPLRKYLPAVFGYVVKDHETSKRFLRDWRGVIGDQFSNEFYGRMVELGRDRGLAVQYETAAGDIFPADILEYFKHADIPMCEFWQPIMPNFVGSLNFKPVKPTASAARIYGKPRVSAEAFTSFSLTWDEHWQMLKEVFNINASEGVTHCVFHTYTHNPRTDFKPPGTSFGSGIGTPFLRGQTWWKYMPEFTDYLTRCCFMLERGKPVSDVLWYLGDEIDHKPDQLYPFPNGYKYDYCNPDVLLNRLDVKDGKLVTPEGIEYSVLWMPDNRRMLPETLEKLHRLVRDGATIIGNRPEGLATLSGGEDAQERFDKAVTALWGEASQPGVLEVGSGKVVSGTEIGDALAALKIQPDIMVMNEEPRSVHWLHRRTEGADWYFLCAPQDSAFKGAIRFRDANSRCEIWDPATGHVRKVRTNHHSVGIKLPKAGSCFVVFRKDKESNSPYVNLQPVTSPVHSLENPWTLAFPDGWGAPVALQTNELKPLKDLDMTPEGKAFSGTVRYATTFNLEKIDRFLRYKIDLGRVEFIAEVKSMARKPAYPGRNPTKLTSRNCSKRARTRWKSTSRPPGSTGSSTTRADPFPNEKHGPSPTRPGKLRCATAVSWGPFIYNRT